jgi:hypothetical protein
MLSTVGVSLTRSCFLGRSRGRSLSLSVVISSTSLSRLRFVGVAMVAGLEAGLEEAMFNNESLLTPAVRVCEVREKKPCFCWSDPRNCKDREVCVDSFVAPSATFAPVLDVTESLILSPVFSTVRNRLVIITAGLVVWAGCSFDTGLSSREMNLDLNLESSCCPE